MMRKIIFLVCFQSLYAFAQADLSSLESREYQATLEVAPDLLELVIDTDSRAHGYLARNHQYIMDLGSDFLINGRLTMDMSFVLDEWLALVIPITFENAWLGQSFANFLGLKDKRIKDSWSVLGGLGVKIRITEWMLKSSLYIQPQIEAGYVYKEYETGSKTEALRAIQLKPSVFLGVETVFDTGFVLGGKIGVEWKQNFNLNQIVTNDSSSRLSVSPMITLGYAW